MLIIFEMEGDLKFIPIFEYIFEGVLHAHYYFYLLYFQPDKILRLN